MDEPIETPYLRAAFLTGPLAALVGVGFAGVVMIASGVLSGDVLSALQGAVRAWLVSMGSGLSVDDTNITIVPIGAWILVVLLVAAVARWVLADPVDELPPFVAATGGATGLVAAICAALTSTGTTEIGLVRATVAGFITGAAGAAIGAVSKHGGGAKLWFTVSENLQRAVRGAVPAVVAMLSAASALVVVLMFVNRGRAGDLWALIDPGFGGGFALALACLLAFPTAILWTCSVLLGPGFSLGSDTSVDLTAAHLGAVPGFPLFAALPGPGEFPGWTFLLGLIPLIAGAISGWRADTAGREGLTPRLVAGTAAGAVAGFGLGFVTGASGGAIGPGRMAEAGPPALTPLLVGTLVMGLGGALGAALAHYRDLRASADRDVAPQAEGSGETPRLGFGRRDDSAGADRRSDEA